jgi:hypothetical protein
MRLNVNVQGLDEVTRGLAEGFSQRRIGALAATAATRTVSDIRTEIQAEMTRVFDRPTPYTLRSVRTKIATAASPVAEVFISEDRAPRDPSPAVVLTPQVEGGPRGTKALEVALQRLGALPAGWRVVPSKSLALDAYGNVRRGLVQDVLAQLRRLRTDSGPRDIRGLRKAARKAGAKYITFKPGGKVQPGVYAADIAGRYIRPVFIFVQRVGYGKRLDFYGVAERVARNKLPEHVGRAFGEMAGKLALRGGA